MTESYAGWSLSPGCRTAFLRGLDRFGPAWMVVLACRGIVGRAWTGAYRLVSRFGREGAQDGAQQATALSKKGRGDQR
jgi:hypothetical protein